MASYKKAAEAMCKQCIYDAKGRGAWKEQVTECTDYLCALYDVRPITTSARVDVRSVVKYQRKAKKAGVINARV